MKLLRLLLCCSLFLACQTTPKPAPGTTSASTTISGDVLIQQSDCASCHQQKVLLTGPSWEAIAQRYASSPKDSVIPALSAKIIKGGSGNWGKSIMLPHPGLSEADAAKMVAYILTLQPTP